MDEYEDKRIEDGTIETQLFSWRGWDGDHECMTYYNPILKVQIGKYPPGTKFDSATILFDKGILQLTDHGPMVNGVGACIARGEYKLHLSVGETISE